jgi:hypothetical protein
MLNENILEQRLRTLEKSVIALQHRLENEPSQKNWLEKLIGSISDEAAFLEAMEYGQTFRQSDQSTDKDKV